jgi:hypothetical protein
MPLTLSIKNYHNGGGDLTLDLKTAVTSEKTTGSIKFYQLIVKRNSDKHSTRLGMFAFIRNTQPGYQSLGFSQMILTFDMHSADGKFLARHITYFYDVAVKSVVGIGNEEEITFITRDKSPDIAVSNIVLAP